MKSKNEMIDNIMDNFDFGRVAKTMEALNWKWVMSVPDEVPQEHDIRKAARKLLKSVPDTFIKDSYCTGTGGLYVQAWYENTDLVLMELTFVVADWRVDVNDED